MNTARVVGTATSTVRHVSMRSWKLLVVQPMQVDGVTPDGFPLIAVDAVNAGPGDLVMITSDGKSTSELLKYPRTPVRWTVIGIVDE
ncbi:EutN/CcmL family microcompartment protein [Blastopirellula marina]|uniref:Ethanolamine utilization protein EutN n=1 Tax=Blastopirellula marina TaxID=124 RepID=A0A2S8GDK8_9BACT|nr:EutN/CcmL family microcompartment protein [Blastopirellula marina]PQO42174.1 ethanolamine utilization protein EutN [Blastopirellula marina]